MNKGHPLIGLLNSYLTSRSCTQRYTCPLYVRLRGGAFSERVRDAHALFITRRSLKASSFHIETRVRTIQTASPGTNEIHGLNSGRRGRIAKTDREK